MRSTSTRRKRPAHPDSKTRTSIPETPTTGGAKWTFVLSPWQAAGLGVLALGMLAWDASPWIPPGALFQFAALVVLTATLPGNFFLGRYTTLAGPTKWALATVTGYLLGLAVYYACGLAGEASFCLYVMALLAALWARDWVAKPSAVQPLKIGAPALAFLGFLALYLHFIGVPCLMAYTERGMSSLYSDPLWLLLYAAQYRDGVIPFLGAAQPFSTYVHDQFHFHILFVGMASRWLDLPLFTALGLSNGFTCVLAACAIYLFGKELLGSSWGGMLACLLVFLGMDGGLLFGIADNLLAGGGFQPAPPAMAYTVNYSSSSISALHSSGMHPAMMASAAALFFLKRYLERGGTGNAWLSGLCLALILRIKAPFAYCLLPAMAITGLFQFLKNRESRLLRAAAAAVVVSTPVLVEAYAAMKRYGYLPKLAWGPLYYAFLAKAAFPDHFPHVAALFSSVRFGQTALWTALIYLASAGWPHFPALTALKPVLHSMTKAGRQIFAMMFLAAAIGYVIYMGFIQNDQVEHFNVAWFGQASNFLLSFLTGGFLVYLLRNCVHAGSRSQLLSGLVLLGYIFILGMGWLTLVAYPGLYRYDFKPEWVRAGQFLKERSQPQDLVLMDNHSDFFARMALAERNGPLDPNLPGVPAPQTFFTARNPAEVESLIEAYRFRYVYRENPEPFRWTRTRKYILEQVYKDGINEIYEVGTRPGT